MKLPPKRPSLYGPLAAFFLASMVSAGPAHAGDQIAGQTDGVPSLAVQDGLIESYRRPGSIPFPEDNPYSVRKAELGKMLFFDPRLSGSNLISCATCHNPSFAWEDSQPTGSGQGMRRLARHTPTILNLAWGEIFMWDGRADTLEEQALGPIQADVEMNQSLESLIEELSNIDGYRRLFDQVFPEDGITGETIGMAIATYERTIVSNLSPFDHWVKGDSTAISESAQRGFILFNTKANCAACHSSWTFTDHSFHDIGLASDDPGRSEIVGLPELKHSFKTPGLRNIVERTPYMHDGSLRTLREVIDHYADGFIQRPTLSNEVLPLDLDETEREDLVSFLRTLSSADDPVEIPVLPN